MWKNKIVCKIGIMDNQSKDYSSLTYAKTRHFVVYAWELIIIKYNHNFKSSWQFDNCQTTVTLNNSSITIRLPNFKSFSGEAIFIFQRAMRP